MRLEFPPARMTREVAAFYIGESLRALDELRALGEITAYGDGKRVHFRKSELDAWVEREPERGAD